MRKSNLAKKIVSYTIIFSAIFLSIIILLLLFNLIKLSGIYLDLLLTVLTFFGAGLVSLNSVSSIGKNNKLIFVSLFLLILSMVLVLLLVWWEKAPDVFTNITWSVVTLSVAFNFIVSFSLKLNKNALVWQTITYSIYGIATIIILLAINVDAVADWKGFAYVLVPLILLGLIFTSILFTFGKKNNDEVLEYVTIAKKEYDEMKDRIRELEKMLENK